MVTKINIFSSLFVILSIISLNHTIFSYHNIQNQYRNNLIKQRSIDKNRQLILLHQQNNSDDYIQKAPSRCIIKKVPNSDCIRAFEYCQNLEGKLKQKDCLVDLLGTAFPGSNKKGKVDPLYWRKLTEVYRQIKYQEKGQVTKETLKERIGIYTAETAEVDIITSTTEKTITTTVKPLTTTRKPPTTISKYSHNHSSDSQESNGKTPEFKNHPAYLLNLKQRIQQAFTRVLMDLSTKFPVVADAFRETIRKRLDGNITENELIKNITLQKNFFEKHPEWMGKLKIIQMQFGMLGKEIQEIESKGREEYQKANETAILCGL